MRKDQKAIIIRVNEEIHCKVKVHSTERYMTVTQWVLQAIFEKLQREEQYE